MTKRGDNAAMTECPTSADKPEWQVLGTGAMACLWACALVEGGHAVRMIPRAPGEAAVPRKVTLQAASTPGPREIALTVAGYGEQGPIHRLLVCTKAIDVEHAVASVAARLSPGAAVVLLQNGMGFQEAVRQLAPHARLFCAVTTEGAWLEEPFRVRHAGGGGTELGCWPSGNLPAAEAIAAELGAGFLPVSAVESVEPLLWRKLAVNCAINPLTALRGCCNGDLLEAGHRQEFEALCAEISTVLRGLGHAGLAGRVAAEAEGVARATAANRSSMRQDLEAGRQTEIAFINGFLVERARERGIPCPLNTALCQRIRAREASARIHATDPSVNT